MTRSIYFQNDQIELDLDESQLRNVIESKQGLLWVDISPGPDPYPILADLFHFHPLAIEDCTDGRVDTPKVDDYGDYLFIVAQSVGFSGRDQQVELVELDMFLGPNYVVTSRCQEMPAVDELFERCCGNQQNVRRGADFLAYSVLDSIVDLLLPAVEDMDEHIDELEQLILDRPDKHYLPEVLRLKRTTLRMRRAIVPERDMVNRLSRGEFGHLIGNDALMFYRDVYDHIVRVEEMLDGLRDLADSTLSSYLSALNNRMNEVMKAMSVVAVIFLPLTLIASIYGTNLDFSPFGIHFKYGFLLMLASMLGVTAINIYIFKRRGWF